MISNTDTILKKNQQCKTCGKNNHQRITSRKCLFYVKSVKKPTSKTRQHSSWSFWLMILLLMSGLCVVLLYIPTIRLFIGETRFKHHGISRTPNSLTFPVSRINTISRPGSLEPVSVDLQSGTALPNSLTSIKKVTLRIETQGAPRPTLPPRVTKAQVVLGIFDLVRNVASLVIMGICAASISAIPAALDRRAVT